MPELLVELVSEPLPGWAQREGAPALAERVAQGLKEAGLLAAHAQAPVVFATPFRLAAHVKGVLGAAPERIEERRGPREGAPDSALAGFMRSVGVDSKDALELRLPKDGKGKARHWFASVRTPPAPARDLLPGVVAAAMQRLPWRKTMRWEENRFRWPRMLRRCLVLLDGEALSMDGVDAPLPKGLVSGAPESVDAHGDPFPVASVADWMKRLEERGAVLDPAARLARIREWYEGIEVRGEAPPEESRLAEAALEALVWEAEAPSPVVAGVPADGILAEFPEVLMPVAEQIKAAPRPGETGGLRRLFFVAERPPGLAPGEAPSEAWMERVRVAAERVALARLADADFHWRRDKATGIDALLEKTKEIQFHPRLGSVFDRAERLEKLARLVAERIGFDAHFAAQAGRYAQADIGSGLVQEIPNLESFVGSRLLMPARADVWTYPEQMAVARSVARYKRAPEYANLQAPNALTLPLLIADRADALVGLWAAGERATGSGDPFAMRRQALHLIEALSEPACRELTLYDVIKASVGQYGVHWPVDVPTEKVSWNTSMVSFSFSQTLPLRDFILERMSYSVRWDSIPYDVVRAVFHAPVDEGEIQDEGEIRYENEILPRGKWTTPIFQAREAAIALNALLREQDGKNLVVAWERAVGFLNDNKARGEWQIGEIDYIEAMINASKVNGKLPTSKKALFAQKLKPALLPEGPEQELHEAVVRVGEQMSKESSAAGRIRLLAQLRRPMDNFIENVRVFEGPREEQVNRLALLASFIAVVQPLADLSHLEGGERGGGSEDGSKSKEGSGAG